MQNDPIFQAHPDYIGFFFSLFPPSEVGKGRGEGTSDTVSP